MQKEGVILNNNIIGKYLGRHLAVICLAMVFLSLPLFFFRGIGTVDDSNFLIIGKWIGHGFKPYIDLIEIKPPGIYYTLYLLKIFFGEAWWVSRIFLLFVNLVSVFLAMLVMKKQKGWLSGLLTAIFLYPTMMLFQGYSIHTEQFCALFGIIALAIIYRKETESLGRAFIFGICIGISVLFKQPGVLYFIAYLFFLLIAIARKKISIKTTVALTLFAVIGFACVWGITSFLLYKSRVFKEFIYYTFIFPTQFGRNTNYSDLGLRFLTTPVFWVIALSILLILKYKKVRFRGVFEEGDLLLWFMFLFSLAPSYLRPTLHYVLCSLFAVIMLISSFWAKIIVYILAKTKPILENQSGLGRFLVALLVIFPALPTIFAMSCMSYFFIREQRLKIDALQTYELGSKIIQFSPNSDEPILCLPDASSRLYYMLERRPYPGYLIMAFDESQWDEKFEEVLYIIENGIVPVVILENSLKLSPGTVLFPGVNLDGLQHILIRKYRQIPLRFAVDKSRGKKITLYVLNDRIPVQRDFQSKIFPKKPFYLK